MRGCIVKPPRQPQRVPGFSRLAGKWGPGLVRNRPGGPRSGAGALLPRPQPLRRFSLHPHQKGRQAVAPRNFEEKNKKAVLQANCLQDRSLRFMRQNSGASPPFSYVTPAFPASFFIPACTLQVLSGGKSFSLHPLCVIIIRYVRKTRERET